MRGRGVRRYREILSSLSCRRCLCRCHELILLSLIAVILEDIATSDSLASSEKRLATVNLSNLPQRQRKRTKYKGVDRGQAVEVLLYILI